LFCALHGDGNRLFGSIGASGVSDHWNDKAGLRCDWQVVWGFGV
jgi:hypothetical protein